MPKVSKNEVVYNHYFDRKTCRHYVNGILTVLHCHHYTALYTQLAIDAGETDLLKESARENFRDVLDKYFNEHSEIDTLQSKIDIGCQYYSLFGLGTMKVCFIGEDQGEVEVPSSHTDSGWIKKWGEYDKPINYITAGFIEALFESVLDTSHKTFIAEEIQSIVMGADISKFKVSRR